MRLASIRSLFRHATASDPLLLPVAQRVLAIPAKRFERVAVAHLTRDHMQSLLDAPDASTETGLRNRVPLTLMYNTGARVSSSLGSFLAGTHACSAVSVAGHSLNAAPVYRSWRRAREQLELGL